MFVVEHFPSNFVKRYREYPVSTADGVTGYPQACNFLKLRHHIHSWFEKRIIEMTIQYIKDRTKCFDYYFPCRRKNVT
ncbi:MAG: hypothetical protein ABJB76_02680 [Candidatus Nitrosocosmicus sp.]